MSLDRKIVIILLFIFVLGVPKLVLADAGSEIMKAANWLADHQGTLDRCQINYTKKVNCKFDSIFKNRFGHKRTWCTRDNARNKPTDKRKFNDCVERANTQFLENQENPLLKSAARKQYRDCMSAIGLGGYVTKNFKAPRFKPVIDWYKSWRLVVECMRDGSHGPKKQARYKNEKNQFGLEVKQYLENICFQRAEQQYGYPSTCFINSCAMFKGDSCIGAIHSKIVARPSLAENLQPSVVDQCISPHRNCLIERRSRRSFGGYICKEDCSGHEAGYEWARNNHFSSRYDCEAMDSNNSQSFFEGCLVFVESEH